MKNRIWFIQLLMIGLILLFATGCKKADTTSKKDPVVSWTNPSDITFGTLLSAIQLNATAEVPGKFFYTPPLGTKLDAGPNQILKVDFVPDDLASYNTVKQIVKINVVNLSSKTDPIIFWTNPADISFGTTLDSIQLNATANVPGKFVYTPPIGTKLKPGANQDLKVDFTPSRTELYNKASKTIKINVTDAIEAIGQSNAIFNQDLTYGSMTDQEGSTYKTIKIGTQTWMAENLRTTKYRNGEAIMHVTDITSWGKLNSGAYCNYENTTDKDKIATFGRLYNWFTISDSRNIAPAGWHVPTDAEWTILENYLGGSDKAGGKMKEISTKHWFDPNTGADNSSGFTGLPNGFRDYNVDVYYIGYVGNYWSASESNATNALSRLLGGNFTAINHGISNKKYGFSIRCLKDDDIQVIVPAVSTGPIRDITSTTANCGGLVTDENGTEIISKGVCWSNSPNPSVFLISKTDDGAGAGSFVGYVTGLTEGTRYYIRAYATYISGTTYGDEISFITPVDSIIIFNPALTYGSVTDTDGNVYKTIQIGTQVWMAENLRTTKYANGDPIANGTDNLNYSVESTPKYYFNYNNEINLINVYGRLYTWFAITDSRGVCPSDYHVPTDKDWSILENYLGGSGKAGGKMKEISTKHWLYPNTGADNSSGFTALPGGLCVSGLGIYTVGHVCNFWLATGNDASSALSRLLGDLFPVVNHNSSDKKEGFSVRCLKN